MRIFRFGSVWEWYLLICLSKPALYRFDPGDWLPWAVRVLFETYIGIALKCLPRQGDILHSNSVTSPQVTSLTTHCCRCVTCERDRLILWQRWTSAGQKIYLYVSARNILARWIWYRDQAIPFCAVIFGIIEAATAVVFCVFVYVWVCACMHAQ